MPRFWLSNFSGVCFVCRVTARPDSDYVSQPQPMLSRAMAFMKRYSSEPCNAKAALTAELAQDWLTLARVFMRTHSSEQVFVNSRAEASFFDS
mmetsp:Transcript_25911/g.51084  ORF Transcript_25911/g.51084 Transcript_25911/m.51084 type:complete len:93 (+) Transcript_25911:1335-1613(+)